MTRRDGLVPTLATTTTRTAGMLTVTRPVFDQDMDQWGQTRGAEVHENGHRLSALLGPDGTPLVYPKQRLGFDLTPRRR